MSKNIQILTGILVLQVLLSVYFFSADKPTAAFTPRDPLMVLNKDKVDRIDVLGKQADVSKTLQLSKVNSKWLMQEYYSFPVDEKKLVSLIDTLVDFKKSYPLGKTMIAAKQFKVTEDEYERKLLVYEDGKVTNTVYIGSSPSFKKVYIRVNNDVLSYGVPFNLFDAPFEAKDWVDRDHLQKQRNDVRAIAMAGVQLTNDNGNFKLATEPEGKVTDLTETSSLATSLLKPEFEEVLGLKENVKHEADVKFSYQLETDNGPVTYNYYLEPKKPVTVDKDGKEKKVEQDYVLVVSDDKYAYKVMHYNVDKLLKVDQASLLKDKAVAQTSTDDGVNEGKGKEGAMNHESAGQHSDHSVGALQDEQDDEQGELAGNEESDDDNQTNL